jgi:hypothetical protein
MTRDRNHYTRPAGTIMRDDVVNRPQPRKYDYQTVDKNSVFRFLSATMAATVMIGRLCRNPATLREDTCTFVATTVSIANIVMAYKGNTTKMLIAFVLFLTAAALTQDINGTTHANLETSYALTFSRSTISASRFNASGDIETTTFKASLEYQQYYYKTLQSPKTLVPAWMRPKQDDQTTPRQKNIEILRDNVEFVTTGLTEIWGLYPDYAAVFLPPIFDSDVQRSVRDLAISREDIAIINYGSSMKVACRGFDFFSGKHVRRTLEERDDHEGPETVFLVLDYQRDYLHCGLLGIWWESEFFYTEVEDTCLECGEKFREVRRDSANLSKAIANLPCSKSANKHTLIECKLFSTISSRGIPTVFNVARKTAFA